MSTVFSQAIDAYRAASGAHGKPAAPAPSREPERSFSNMVADAVKDAVDTGKKSEQMSMSGIAGEAELNDVITAVANAEVTLKTAVTLRDRVVGAYKEVLRMPI
ncbi:MAG: flagellar hook-basal body complex protein FliE [Acetobacterales bacterium]